MLYLVNYKDGDGNTFIKEVFSDLSSEEDRRRNIIEGMVSEGFYVTKLTILDRKI